MEEKEVLVEKEIITERTTPLKAIKAKCYDCSYFNWKEVKFCQANSCPLFPFRKGKNPFAKRILTDEQRVAASERLTEYHRQRKLNSNGNESQDK